MKITESQLRGLIKQELTKVINEMAKLDPAVAAERAAKAKRTKELMKAHWAEVDARAAARNAAMSKRNEEGKAPLYPNPPSGMVPNPAFYRSLGTDARSGYAQYELKPEYKDVPVSPIYIKDPSTESPFAYSKNQPNEIQNPPAGMIPNPDFYEIDPRTGKHKLKDLYRNVSDLKPLYINPRDIRGYGRGY